MNANGPRANAARDGQVLPLHTNVAQRNGMKIDEMRTCIDAQPELVASIKKSRDDAAAKGVKGTPNFFTNDERIENRSRDYLKLVIETKIAGLPTPEPGATAIEPTPVTTTPAAH